MGPERSDDGAARRPARGRPRRAVGVGLAADDCDRAALAAADRRWREARAERAELETARLRGTLVDAAAVERRAFQRGRAVRDALLNWPATIAGRLAAQWGVDEDRVLVDLQAEVSAFLVRCMDGQAVPYDAPAEAEEVHA